MSTASAGGLSGSNYQNLRAWFYDHDTISDDLTAVLNLMVAGKIPKSVVPLFTAGRGIAIPKNENGDLRPIVVGHILLRLIGSLAVTSLSEDINNFFLKPSATQFGVGVPGGCELMATAIACHLEAHPDHIDISCDARNAFNSYSREKLWRPLHQHFPKLYAFAKMVYGEAADIIFFEEDCGITKVLNSVGSRQGCSLGSLLYCIAIQPLILQLRQEFPDLLILAFCDDVHFVGDPKLVHVSLSERTLTRTLY
jgi:hypothetical protein